MITCFWCCDIRCRNGVRFYHDEAETRRQLPVECDAAAVIVVLFSDMLCWAIVCRFLTSQMMLQHFMQFQNKKPSYGREKPH